jgi:hypothetical protein
MDRDLVERAITGDDDALVELAPASIRGRLESRRPLNCGLPGRGQRPIKRARIARLRRSGDGTVLGFTSAGQSGSDPDQSTAGGADETRRGTP